MSIKIKVYNQKCEPVSEMKLSVQVFGVKASEALVHQAVVTQMANERQILAHTKIRSEVRGGGRKPWRQKGTGRARAGTIRSPIWKGGGVTFGPRKDRNFKKKINKKMKQKAMFMVLSDKVANERLVVLDKLEMGEYKAKVFSEILKGFEERVLRARQQDSRQNGEGSKPVRKPRLERERENREDRDKKLKRSILVINDKKPSSANLSAQAGATADKNDKIKYSGRNLAGVKIINLDNINIIDLLKYKSLILTKESIKKLEERYK